MPFADTGQRGSAGDAEYRENRQVQFFAPGAVGQLRCRYPVTVQRAMANGSSPGCETAFLTAAAEP